MLHRQTDGNPLFLVNTVDDLIARGSCARSTGSGSSRGRLEDIALGRAGDAVADGREAGRAADRGRAGDAGGRAAWRARSSRRRSRPRTGSTRTKASGGARRWRAAGQFLRAAGVAEWPDGTVAGRYAFIHALYQQRALCARLHRASGWACTCGSGERLERGYGQRAGEIAGELAMHFERGRDFERALQYRRQAGEHALRQHGYREAADARDAGAGSARGVAGHRTSARSRS